MRHLCIRSVVNSKNAIIVLLAFYRMYLTFFNDPYMSKFLNVLKTFCQNVSAISRKGRAHNTVY